MKEYYRQLIIDMLPEIKSERFLCQIYSIIRRHMKRESISINE